MIREDTVQGLRRVTLEAGALVVSVLPELGGKISSLRLKDSDRDVLLPPQDSPYRRAEWGASFEGFDTSGFDECFPTVAACASPDDGEALADHGELWSARWGWKMVGDVLAMTAELPGRPWVFRRWLSVSGSTLRLDYEVENLTDTARRFLWSSHPLLRASPGSRIHLPFSVREVLVEYATGPVEFERGDMAPWPNGKDVLQGADAGTAYKLFAGPLDEGFCAYEDAESGISTLFRFDVRQVPYVGLWICQGGWPTSRAAKHFTVALEPCSGRPDALADAAARGECRTLPPRGVQRWTLEVELRRGAPGL